MEFLVTAKPIVWTPESNGQEWHENGYGFSITLDPDEEEDYRYHAIWGEGPEDDFPTLVEAQQWCQSVIDDYVRQVALVTPNIEGKGLAATSAIEGEK